MGRFGFDDDMFADEISINASGRIILSEMSRICLVHKSSISCHGSFRRPRNLQTEFIKMLMQIDRFRIRNEYAQRRRRI